MRVIDEAGPSAMVLLDEVATGTDPEEGASLACAVVDALVARGAAVAVTTHYERLKAMALEDPRLRNASVGFDVVVGSRSKYRAMEVRDALLERWPGRSLAVEAADNEGAAAADVVVIATPWDAAAATAKSVDVQLQGKVVISMANALAKVGHEFQPLVPPRGSVAASVQAAVPRSRVAAALHQLATHHRDVRRGAAERRRAEPQEQQRYLAQRRRARSHAARNLADVS